MLCILLRSHDNEQCSNGVLMVFLISFFLIVLISQKEQIPWAGPTRLHKLEWSLKMSYANSTHKLIRVYTMKPELYAEILRMPSSNQADLVAPHCQTKPENSNCVSFQSSKITNSLQIKSWLYSLTKVIMSYNGTTTPSFLVFFFSLSLSQVAFRKSLQTSHYYKDGLF